MSTHRFAIFVPLLLAGCATEAPTEPPYDPLEDYVEVDAATVVDAPDPVAGNFAPDRRYEVKRGEYLVELLGCGACHTNGALEGAPQMDKALAGSDIGIAYSNPLGNEKPGVVFPSNITPDEKTGIGGWSDEQIAMAIRAGIGSHMGRRIAVMPWQGYGKMTEEDVNAIVSYLRSIAPVEHKVPDEVIPGTPSKHPFVYLGVYRSR